MQYTILKVSGPKICLLSLFEPIFAQNKPMVFIRVKNYLVYMASAGRLNIFGKISKGGPGKFPKIRGEAKS